ncbi:MAG TPA: BNR-4 repeat-containing protein [Mycobacteriales bacterium]|nr:BNR-4 repeat-containing protein [Mycobacteriales bacterium]
MRRVALPSLLMLGLLVSPALASPVPQVVGLPTALVAQDGAWCWFSEPRAISAGGTTYLGWISSRGDITVGAVGADGRTRTTVLMAGFEVNDHDHPSLLLRPDGRLQAFWSGHNGGELYTRIAVRPHDISQWGRLRTVPLRLAGDRVSTYANPVYLKGERRLWVFGRSGYTGPAFTTSGDVGETWAKARRLVHVHDERPYVKYASNGVNTIGFGFTNGHPAESHSSIYYAAYRAGEIRRADGRRIARLDQLPISPAQADVVYAAPKGRDAWIHDVAHDKQGRPRVVFATRPAAGGKDHDYWYAAWDGRRWLARRITAAGGSIADSPRESRYTAGISLDHSDPSTVVLARPGATALEIERWHTSDLGKSWTTERVTVASHQDNMRPVVPRGGSGQVVWMTGQYGFFTSFRTSVAGNQPVFPRAALPTWTQGSARKDGRLIAIKGGLSSAGLVSFRDKELTLQSRPVGWQSWTTAAVVATDNRGQVSVRLPPRSGYEYRWLWPGDHEAERSESATFAAEIGS